MVYAQVINGPGMHIKLHVIHLAFGKHGEKVDIFMETIYPYSKTYQVGPPISSTRPLLLRN